MPRLPSLWLFAVLASLPLAAQKVPAPGDPDRVVQVFALGPVLDNLAHGHPDPAIALLHRRDTAMAVAKAMHACMQPPLDLRGGIEVLGGETLVALALPQQLAWIEAVLQRLARQDAAAVAFASQLLRVPDAVFQAQVKPTLDALQSATLTEEQGDVLLTMLRRDHTVTKMATPQLLLLAAQSCDVSVREKVPYRRDVTPHTLADGSTVWDTVWGEVHDGPAVTLTWLPERDRRIAIAADVVLQQVIRPIPTFDSEVQGRKITVDLPEVRATQIRGRAALEPGGMLLMAAKAGDHWLVMALTWRRN